MSRTPLIAGLGIAGVLAALVGAQLPEIRRYLKIRSM
jgi:hypothetical protein